MRFSALVLLLSGLIFDGFAQDSPPIEEASLRPPNVVFIFIDDMGFADPSCFGNPTVKTPHIDQLAAEGIKLTNFYVNSPICSASRVSVTTGQYHTRWGIHSYLNSRAKNKDRGMKDYLSADAPTTAKMLKAKGYATAHFGKWHMGGGRDVDDAPLPQAYGFDESLVAFEGLGDRLLAGDGGLVQQSRALGKGEIFECERHEKTAKYVDRAIDFIERNREKPFFVRMFPNDVHDSHDPAAGAAEKWKETTDNPFDRKFFAVLEEMDRQIGRLVGKIDELGLAENTLIIFTSDNGPTDWPKYYKAGETPPGFTGPYFGRKWSLFEGGIRMPFIARWKGKIPAGKTDSTSPMMAIDLSPTIAKFTGAPIPEGVTLDGVDQSTVLLGTPSGRSKPLFWQYGAPHAKLMPGNPKFRSPALAVRNGPWKLLIDPDGTNAHLFNLDSDPSERMNVVNGQPATAGELWKKIQAWGADVGIKTVADSVPQYPYKKPEKIQLPLNGKRENFTNSGVIVMGDEMKFGANSAYLELPKALAPNLKGKELIITVELSKADSNTGVLVAQGGSRCGYSLYLKNGKAYFAVCRDGERTTIATKYLLKGYPTVLEGQLLSNGEMRLLETGHLRGSGKAAGLLTSGAGDTIHIGADLISRVGDYDSDLPFQGVIGNVNIEVREPEKVRRK